MLDRYDVVIGGGGPGGVCAAVFVQGIVTTEING
jgi:thioredoxin reductase